MCQKPPSGGQTEVLKAFRDAVHKVSSERERANDLCDRQVRSVATEGFERIPRSNLLAHARVRDRKSAINPDCSRLLDGPPSHPEGASFVAAGIEMSATDPDKTAGLW